MSAKYQIRYLDRKGHGHFEHFEAESIESAKALAVHKANEMLNEKRWHNKIMVGDWFYRPYVPLRTVHVVEVVKDLKSEREFTSRQDGTTKKIWNWIAKRGGAKFKLKLFYCNFKFSDGNVIHDEWYSL